jgi:hypothetical protein
MKARTHVAVPQPLHVGLRVRTVVILLIITIVTLQGRVVLLRPVVVHVQAAIQVVAAHLHLQVAVAVREGHPVQAAADDK